MTATPQKSDACQIGRNKGISENVKSFLRSVNLPKEKIKTRFTIITRKDI